MARALFPISFPASIALCLMLLTLPLAAQDLRVEGGDEDLRARLAGDALVLSGKSADTPGDLIATAKGDYGRLLAILYEEGYFSATVSIRLGGREASTLTSFNAPAALGAPVVEIATGPRFTFGRADIRPLAPNTTAIEGFSPGATAGTAQIEAAGRGALADWRDASHAKAAITGQEVVARHRAAELDVALAIDPGPALRFGRLITPPDASVSDRRLQQIAGMPSGEAFSPDGVRDVRRRLVDTGTFNSVVVSEADIPNPDGTLDLELALEAAPLRRLGFGAEIETTNGLSLEAFWLHRNFRGRAQRLRFDASIKGIGGETGGVDVSLGTTLSIPGFRRADDTLELGLLVARIDDEEFEENLVQLTARRERRVNETLVIGQGVGFRFSESRDAFGTRTFGHLILGADAERDRRDDPLNPRAGTYGILDARPFIAVAGGDTGLKFDADLRAYRSLGARTVIAGRAQLGTILLADLEGTPPDFLYYSGGGGTVRGQGFESLGVVQDVGTTGGRGFAGLSLEVRQNITEALGVVGFLDYGYVSESGTFESGEGHGGAGLGVRYNTALGPLRVDLGVPVGESSDGTSYALYIGLGQAF
ncbi:MAG: BamA/TamA family outer membrane protein [Pseudomonadota bacterium]